MPRLVFKSSPPSRRGKREPKGTAGPAEDGAPPGLPGGLQAVHPVDQLQALGVELRQRRSTVRADLVGVLAVRRALGLLDEQVRERSGPRVVAEEELRFSIVQWPREGGGACRVDPAGCEARGDQVGNLVERDAVGVRDAGRVLDAL